MTNTPNIVVVTTHDSGRHFGCYGVETVQTPAIDALADDGVLFTQMFATSSICSPSRGSLMTGQYPQRNGLTGLAGGCWNWELTDPKRHLSHVLRDAGYRTGLFGFQHETANIPSLGFDRHEHGTPSTDGKKADAVGVAQAFAQFLQDDDGAKPFYAQIGFFETHTPYDRGGATPDDPEKVTVPAYAREDTEELRAHVAALHGAVRVVDQAVRITTDALRQSGREDDTLLLFNTDHGVELPRAKWTMFDAGLGIAFIMRWPGAGITGGKKCKWLLNNTDFLPTLAELTGLPVAHQLDGVSFAAALPPGETPAEGPRDTVYALFVNAEIYAARSRDYKLIRNFREGHTPAAQLFDLARDPLELEDLAQDPAHAEILADINERFWRWLKQVEDPILQGPVPTPYYHRAMADYHTRAEKE